MRCRCACHPSRSQVVRSALVFSDVRMPGEMDGVALAGGYSRTGPMFRHILASGDIGKENAMKDLCGAEAIHQAVQLFDAAADKIRTVMAKGRPPT